MSNRLMPVVVDGGTHKATEIDRLKRGKGDLLDEVREIVELTRSEMGAAADGVVLVPVVVVYRKRRGARVSTADC